MEDDDKKWLVFNKNTGSYEWVSPSQYARDNTAILKEFVEVLPTNSKMV